MKGVDELEHEGAFESTYTFVLAFCLYTTVTTSDGKSLFLVSLRYFRTDSVSHRGLEMDLSTVRDILEKGREDFETLDTALASRLCSILTP